MAMVIKNNMAAQLILGETTRNSKALSKSLKKVSSGMRINGAEDDASGYAISERMRVQMRGLEQDIRNTQNASSLMKTAEGAVESTVVILRTLKEKALDAANDTNTDIDRATIQKEVDQFIEQIDDNAHVTYNGKYMLNGPSTPEMKNVEDAIVRALNSEWFKNCLDLVDESFGLNFEEEGATVKDIDVKFINEDNNWLAWVTHWSAGGEATQLRLTVNMKYYNGLVLDDVNGRSTTPGASMLDRTIAHELTHAVMAANIKNFSSLPKYIKEGTAELVHGIDDTRGYTIRMMMQSSRADDLANLYRSNTEFSDVASSAYAGGYVLLRYLAKQSGSDPLETIKTFMNSLDNSTSDAATAYDNAVHAASGGTFANADALITQFMADFRAHTGDGYNNAASNAFLLNYCGINLSNEDTGSITGADASGGPVKTAESVVPEVGPTSVWKNPTQQKTTINGLTVTWPSEYVYGNAKLSFQFQVGTKANMAIRVGFSNMRAEAMGLRQSDGKTTISLATREDASAAIDVIDAAIDYALDEQTTIGAVQNRLQYTESNLTTAHENTTASDSTIRDADMAKEMTEYTKANVLLQAAQSMLAQANQNSSSVLGLLQ